MKLSKFQSLLCLAVGLTLTGCSGLNVSFPNVAPQNSPGAIHGSVFGGHAPIEGARIFLLEAQSTGYGDLAKNLLTGSATTEDTSGDATNGFYYVTSNSSGNFSITGDYTCDVGYPVYVYASGGAAGTAITTTTTTTTTTITITDIAETDHDGTYTYTFTAKNALTAGQNVTFSDMTDYGTGLNNKTVAVIATGLSGTKFEISTTTKPGTEGKNGAGGTGIASYTTTTTTTNNNPAIVNMALLGLCPESRNFTASGTPSTNYDPISFVYMNEVSTASMAYAMAGFATDSLHIGSSSSNLVGLQNAANNAANLYNIQNVSQIANATTPAGNGTVPQTELDTIGNILASCVDSGNTSTDPSMQCNTLFADATSTGASGGTVPIDTATAAINMANNPGTANVRALFTLQSSGTPPFTPDLGTAPDDFTVAITYTGSTDDPLKTPSGIAIDASGNAFVSSGAADGYISELSPMGAVTATSAAVSNGLSAVAVDPSGNIWATQGSSSGALYEFKTGTLATLGTFGTGSLNAPTDLAIDNDANVYVADGGNNNVLAFNAAGTLTTTFSDSTDSCFLGVSQIALDTFADIFATSTANNTTCYVVPNLLGFLGNYQEFSSTTATSPHGIAVDGNYNGWVASESLNHVYSYSFISFGDSTTYGSAAGGLDEPEWIAIDGGNNVWVTNTGNAGEVSEYTNGGTAVTGTNGYQHGNLSAPSSIAIDNAGDVWIANSGSNTVTEILGSATPATTPLSALAPGTEP